MLSKFKLLATLLGFFFISNIHAQNITTDRFGKALTILAKDSSFYLKFGFRFQTLYVGEHDVASGDWSESLMVRRYRLKFDGWAYSPKIQYKMELGLSNRDTQGGRIDQSGNTASIILDAVIKWNFAPDWNLWFGQTKLPGNRERMISSQKLQFVDRSLVNSRFTLDRDVGVQLHHKSTVGGVVLKQAFAISTGEGRGIIVANPDHGRQYTARMEILPFGYFTSKGDYFGADLKREPSPKLSIGVTGDYNNNTVRSRANLGSFVTDDAGEYVYSDFQTVLIDGIFKYKGFSVSSEYAYRTAPKKVDSFGYGKGVTGSAGYLFSNNIELAARYTHIEPLSSFSSIDNIDEYMIGFSKYIVGHSLKVQTDFSYTEIKNEEKFYRFRLQCELAL